MVIPRLCNSRYKFLFTEKGHFCCCHVTGMQLCSVTDNLLGVSVRFSVWVAYTETDFFSTYKIHSLLNFCDSKN